jgi:hypothetical protein
MWCICPLTCIYSHDSHLLPDPIIFIWLMFCNKFEFRTTKYLKHVIRKIKHLFVITNSLARKSATIIHLFFYEKQPGMRNVKAGLFHSWCEQKKRIERDVIENASITIIKNGLFENMCMRPEIGFSYRPW